MKNHHHHQQCSPKSLHKDKMLYYNDGKCYMPSIFILHHHINYFPPTGIIRLYNIIIKIINIIVVVEEEEVVSRKRRRRRVDGPLQHSSWCSLRF